MINQTSNNSVPRNTGILPARASSGSDTIFMLMSVMTLSIFGNSLVIVAFRRFRRLRTVTNYFLVSLSVADLLLAALSMPCWMVIRLSEVSEVPRSRLEYMIPYYIWQYVDIVCSTASITNLCVICLDRHLAISSPLTYYSKMTSRRAVMAIACGWIYAAVCAGLSFVSINNNLQPTAGKVYAVFISLAAFFFPLSIILTFYGRIFNIALKQARSLAIEDTLVYGAEKERRSLLQRELKVTKTIAIVIGAFVICWAPFFTILMTFAACGSSCVSDSLWIAVSKWMQYFSTTINPLIYTLCTRTFRQAFKEMLRCRSNCLSFSNGPSFPKSPIQNVSTGPMHGSVWE